MDFISIIKLNQERKGLTDAEVCNFTGISEYSYYDLTRYKMYLTRVAYFALCAVFELPILESKEIDALLAENKELVGNPSTNLTIAAETINPDYLTKLEKELNSLKVMSDNADRKNKVIQKLEAEIAEVVNTLSEKEKQLNEKIQEAYSDGIRDAMVKIPVMQEASNQTFINLLNEEYTEKIDKLENALSTAKKKYSELYKYVKAYVDRDVIGEKLDISSFEEFFGE